jgi:hypothetical protein
MLAESSVEKSRQAAPSFDLRPAQRLAMVCLAYVPLLHALVSAGTAIVVYRYFGAARACFAGAAVLYLVPPLAVAAARPRAHLTSARVRVGSREFFRWWYTAQWQIVFNRFPQLEEALRLVPGLYSAWLRLWGARIGGLVYWSPGLSIYDRPFVEVGSRVVIGADTKLSPHLLARGAAGATELVLAPIKIGRDAMIGGSSLLPAGVCVGECEQTPGARPLAPFSQFKNGRHQRTNRFHQGNDSQGYRS